MKLLCYIGLIWLAYVFVGYPLLLGLCGVVRRFRPVMREDFWPSVSVLIAARNEEKDIGWKLRETLAWNYPPERLEVLVVSDASDDDTDKILQAFPDPRQKFIRMPERVGKNAALNRLSELARGELLFFTDANSHIPASCLHKIVRHFADARVGCVTGWERAESGETSPGMTAGGSAYLGYESFINSLESELGSVLVCDGSVFCIRRNLFFPLQPDLANDLELPVRIGEKGYAVVYEPSAYSMEKNTSSPREEFNRRRRICGQGILGFWRLRQCLHGLRVWQFLSRKLLRWLAFVPMAMILVASARLADRPIFVVLLALQLALYLAAGIGWWLAARRKNSARLITLPFYFLLVNLGALIGVIEACLGRRFSVWEIPALSRGREATG